MSYSSKQFQEYALDVKIRQELSDDIRYEQIGKVIYLMTIPSRIHEAIVQQIQKQMGIYFDDLDSSCMVYGSNSSLDLSERVDFLKGFDEFQDFFSESDFQQLSFLPDVQVICDDEGEDSWTSKGYKGIPGIAVEVLSPSTKIRDLTIKKDFYERVGISEYWIIEDIRKVTVYTLINGKYVPKEFSLCKDSEEVLEVKSELFKDLTVNFNKKYFYKFKS